MDNHENDLQIITPIDEVKSLIKSNKTEAEIMQELENIIKFNKFKLIKTETDEEPVTFTTKSNIPEFTISENATIPQITENLMYAMLVKKAKRKTEKIMPYLVDNLTAMLPKISDLYMISNQNSLETAENLFINLDRIKNLQTNPSKLDTFAMQLYSK